MENASKALIIAGAILLSILIISLGLVIYNQAKDAVGSGGLDEQQISAFNSKFTQYEGTQTGVQVNALIQQVISTNQAATNDGTNVYVKLTYPLNATPTNSGTDTSIDGSGVTTQRTKVNVGLSYDVSFTYAGGRISEIKVVKK